MNRKTSTKKRFHYNAIWFWSFISVSRGPFWFAGPVTHRSGMLRACSKRDKSFTPVAHGPPLDQELITYAARLRAKFMPKIIFLETFVFVFA